MFNVAHTAQHSDKPLASIPLFHKFIDMALKKGGTVKRHIGDAYTRIARVYAENGEFVKAEIMLTPAIDIAENLSDKDICFAFLHNNIGNVFQLLGNSDKAFKFYSASMKIRITFGDDSSTHMAAVYRNMGFSLRMNQAFFQSLKYYLKAYRILKLRCDKDDPTLVNIKAEMGLFAVLPFEKPVMDGIPIKTPLGELKATYEKNKDNIQFLEQYLFGIVRDMLVVPFNEGCDLYIDLVELIEANLKVSSLFGFFSYAFANIRNSLKAEVDAAN